MRQGDASAFLSWAPEPLDEAELDAIWVDALAHGPRLPTLLYVHIPHCVSSCNFCMYFHRVTQDEAVHRATLEHLVAHVRRFRRAAGRLAIAGSYIGGGTPTAMPIAMLETLLGELQQNFVLTGELTIEGHPGVTSVDAIARLAHAGVTRLSMGLQTFDVDLQRKITRLNPRAAHIGELLAAGRTAGVITNVDLVVGFPGQTRASFDRDLEALLALEPDSITIYRYHPTSKLAGGDLDLDAVVDLNQWQRWTKAGYLGTPSSRGANSVVLFIANARLAGYAWAQLRGLLEPEARVGRYEAFGTTPRHLLGFGTGGDWSRVGASVA